MAKTLPLKFALTIGGAHAATRPTDATSSGAIARRPMAKNKGDGSKVRMLASYRESSEDARGFGVAEFIVHK